MIALLPCYTLGMLNPLIVRGLGLAVAAFGLVLVATIPAHNQSQTALSVYGMWDEPEYREYNYGNAYGGDYYPEEDVSEYDMFPYGFDEDDGFEGNPVPLDYYEDENYYTSQSGGMYYSDDGFEGNPVFLDDYEDENYYMAQSSSYYGGTYYEAPWYESIIPVSYIGCTYFGAWCDNKKPTYTAPAPKPPKQTVTYQPAAPAYTYPSYQQRTPSAPSSVSCDISATPQSILEGEGVTLMWQAENATAVYNQDGQRVSSNSIVGIRPRETQTFQLTVYGADGGVNYCQTTVRVTQDPPLNCNLVARQKKVERGQGSELAWNVPAALKASISGIGEVSYSGGYMVYPERTTTYQLRVLDRDGGTQTCTASVEVVESPDDDWFNFSFTKASDLSDFVRMLDEDSPRDWADAQNIEDAYTSTPFGTTDAPKSQNSLPQGGTSQAMPPCMLAARPSMISKGGMSSLEWRLPAEASGYINGVGQVSGNGFMAVSPQMTTAYTMTVATNSGSSSCTAEVVVRP